MKLLKIVSAIFLALLFLSCNSNNNTAPKAENGVLDLKGWDWEKDGPVNLGGEWKFIKNSEHPDFIKPGFDDSQWQLFSMPRLWHTIFERPDGYYYFRLKVELDNPGNLGIYLERVFNAYTLYINGKEILKAGKAGNTKEETIPQQIPLLKSFEADGPLYIVVKISSFRDIGGTHELPRIGLLRDLSWEKYVFDLFSLAILGLLCITGLYHFFLWLKMRQNKASFYFSFFCFGILLSLIGLNRVLEQLFPLHPMLIYHIDVRISYLGPIFSSFFAPLFFKTLFPEDFSKKVLWFFQTITFLFILYVLFNIAEYTLFFMILYEFYVIILGSWVIFSLIRAVFKKRKFSLYILAGFIIFFLTILHDIVNHIHSFHSFTLAPTGMSIFITLQSFTISDIFVNAFKQSEYLSKNLQIEVKKQTENLETALEELKISQQEKNIFFQNFSHEIRTPLSLILTPIESALVGSYGTVPDRLKTELELIQSNSSRINHFINQILDLSRIDSGKMTLKLRPVNLISIITDIIADFKTLAAHKKIRYTFVCSEKLCTIYADSVMIDNIMFNLLSNAFKFTPEGGNVEVSLEKEAEFVKIKVTDSGNGIPPGEQEHIFKRFHQVDSSLTRRHEGSGIGLALVKEYVQLHKGEVAVSSSAGQGAAFSFTIPTGLEESENKNIAGTDLQSDSITDTFTRKTAVLSLQKPAVSTNYDKDRVNGQEINHGRPTILLVEDNRDLQNLVFESLKSDYSLYLADNGYDALELVENKPRPQVIISDIMMPGMDGISFYHALQEKRGMRDIPFIFLTAKTRIDDRLKGLSLGAIDYICKPFSINELQYKVKSIIENYNLKKALFEKDKFSTIGMLFGGLSHEILNPLGNVLAPLRNLEIFLEKQNVGQNERIEGYFSRINTNLQRITKLIKSFKLLFFKKELFYDDINLEEIILSVRELFSKKLEGPVDFSWHIEPAFTITATYDGLTHILINLISNAIDAVNGQEKQTIHIEASMQGSVPLVKVRDNGSGIEESELENIFNPFYTGKEVGTGTGLGLFFVKSIVLKTGWDISVSSKKQEGTEFILTCFPNKESSN